MMLANPNPSFAYLDGLLQQLTGALLAHTLAQLDAPPAKKVENVVEQGVEVILGVEQEEAKGRSEHGALAP